MDSLAYITVKESPSLRGTVQISGAKNAVLPIIAATLLADGTSVIKGVPNLKDVQVMVELVTTLGAKAELKGDSLFVNASHITSLEAPHELVNKMRASFLVMGALLSRFQRAKISLPGGCAIGSRPIDLHLKGFEALGAKVENNKNQYIVSADKLKGADIYLDFASVGATINIMLAAVKAEGTTTIDNAAKEPEIVNLLQHT